MFDIWLGQKRRRDCLGRHLLDNDPKTTTPRPNGGHVEKKRVNFFEVKKMWERKFLQFKKTSPRQLFTSPPGAPDSPGQPPRDQFGIILGSF